MRYLLHVCACNDDVMSGLLLRGVCVNACMHTYLGQRLSESFRRRPLPPPSISRGRPRCSVCIPSSFFRFFPSRVCCSLSPFSRRRKPRLRVVVVVVGSLSQHGLRQLPSLSLSLQRASGPSKAGCGGEKKHAMCEERERRQEREREAMSLRRKLLLLSDAPLPSLPRPQFK